ncbi:MAG: hypothetical protein GKC06_00900 [Methanomicrobiales archaeon]|nr:hypothetical protein [Methanomicrobiales archaeon]
MSFPEIRCGVPVECVGFTILPVLRQFCGRAETGVIGSVTPIALFIVKEPDVWFIPLEEGCSPEELVSAIRR